MILAPDIRARRPVAADSDSGTLERNTAITTATLTPSPSIIETPIAADSGMPSRIAPSTMPSAAASGPGPLERLRSAPPIRSSARSPRKKTSEPAASPAAAASKPPERTASAVSSKLSALISTPAPKAITSPITRRGTSHTSPAIAPASSARPPTKPHNAASSTPRGYPARMRGCTASRGPPTSRSTSSRSAAA